MQSNTNRVEQALQFAAQQIDAGQLQTAEDILRQILKQQPGHAAALHLLGVLAHKAGKPMLAVDLIGKAIELQPDVAQYHANRGEMCRLLGRLGAAIKHGELAVRLAPNLAMAHSNLGIAFFDMNNYQRAASCQQKALALDPTLVQALNNLGSIKSALKDFEGAIACFRRVLELAPGYPESMNNLGHAQVDAGQLDAAIASYHRALEINPGYTACHSNLLFALNYTSSYPHSYCLQQAREFGRLTAARVGTRFSSWTAPASPERLRVGLVSGDLRNHSAGHFLEGLITHISSDRIELYAYPTRHGEDELTARIKPYFSAWKPLTGIGDEGAARLIHADGIHILLDLSGHTAHNRLPLFAWKPAPVQASWLGYFATTGMTEMDYFIGDQWLLPKEEEHHFVEKGWHLSGASSCLMLPQEEVNIGNLPALQNRSVTFGTLNNYTKMNDRVVACWSRILKEIPDSRLLLNMSNLQDDALRANVTARYAAHGIAENRLILESTIGRAAALNSYNRIDIALDPFPYPGGTTSYEALWMGVPVLTLRGNNYISHLGESILNNAGLPDWIASSEEDYIAKAVSMSSNLEKLAALRYGLRQQVLLSPLFDAPRFARSFEDALWGMWRQTGQERSSSPS